MEIGNAGCDPESCGRERVWIAGNCEGENCCGRKEKEEVWMARDEVFVEERRSRMQAGRLTKSRLARMVGRLSELLAGRRFQLFHQRLPRPYDSKSAFGKVNKSLEHENFHIDFLFNY
jgi:hypothetical protein